jgi:Helicase associated domain
VIYKEREGHCRVPQRHEENGFRLGSWVSHQRSKGDTMPVERRQQLDELGFVWDAREATWEDGFICLKAYKEREGHCRVPDRHLENGFRLGQWVGAQRIHRDDLSDEHRQRLNELGFVWEPHKTDWEEGFRHLVIYKEREGHCRVPDRHMEDGFRLGQWVSHQRSKGDRMPVERRRQLDELGFVWNVLDKNWEEGFRHLTT